MGKSENLTEVRADIYTPLVDDRDSLIDRVIESMKRIHDEEPEAAVVILAAIEHISGTYSDKYDSGKDEIDTKKQLYGPAGAAINTYQIMRYLQRYNTVGHSKSGLVKDLMKGVHYFVFELTRRFRNKRFLIEEPKV